jgi:hypothetical protein
MPFFRGLVQGRFSRGCRAVDAGLRAKKLLDDVEAAVFRRPVQGVLPYLSGLFISVADGRNVFLIQDMEDSFCRTASKSRSSTARLRSYLSFMLVFLRTRDIRVSEGGHKSKKNPSLR